jgi:hypothetical protein
MIVKEGPMDKNREIKSRELYHGERASFTTDNVVELHAALTEKPVITEDEVLRVPAYGLEGYRKGLYDFPNSVVSWSVTEIDPGVKSQLYRQLHEATHLHSPEEEIFRRERQTL